MDGTPTEARTHRTPGEYLAGALGAVYLAVGVLGFFVTSGVGFAARDGGDLLGVFEVNPLHNIVHLAIGVALLAAFAAGAGAVRVVAAVIGATYLLVGVVGFVVQNSEANILALNTPDHVLHLGSAIALLVAASLARQRTGVPATR
jgi:hypothetical protein